MAWKTATVLLYNQVKKLEEQIVELLNNATPKPIQWICKLEDRKGEEP